MTREEKITAGVVAAAIILLILWLMRGSSAGSTTVINESQEGATYDINGFPIDIPSLTLPPRRGPILWPSLEMNGEAGPLPQSSPYNIAGRSTCACGDGTTQTYIRPPEPTAAPQVIQQLYRSSYPAVRASSSMSFSSSPAPQNGYLNASGHVTSGVWW